MKSIYKIAVTLLASLGLISLQGCDGDKGYECPLEEKVEATITFALSNNTLKATTTVQPNADECKIESVTALLFEEGKLVTSTEPTKNGDRYSVPVDREGIFELYVVANADTDLKKVLSNPNLTLTELKSITTKASLDGSQPLVMTTPKINIGYAEAGKIIDAGTLRLKRISSRIQLYNRVQGLAITKVKYLNRVEEGTLIGTPMEAGQLSLAEVANEVAEGGINTTPTTYFYSYPSPTEQGAKLVIEATLNGNPLSTPIEVSVERIIEADKVYSIVLHTDRVIGEPLNPENPYKDLIKTGLYVQEWSNATELTLSDPQELQLHTPDFVVSAKDDLLTVEEGTPTIVNIPGSKYTFTLTTTITNDLSEVVAEGEGADYLSIYNESKELEANNMMKQVYSITVPENPLSEARTFTIVVRNAYDPALSKTILLKQAVATSEPTPTPDPAKGNTPLSLFAQYNINKEGTGFATSNANGVAGYFTYKQIIGAEALDNGQTFTPPAGYRVPTAYELFLIIPYKFDLPDSKELKIPGYGDKNLPSILNVTEGGGYNGDNKQYSADYAFKDYSWDTNKTIYALRQKKLEGARSDTWSKFPSATDDSDKVAYRYEIAQNPYNNQSMQNILIITARYIGESMPEITISDVAKDEFWNDPAANYDKLELPLDGYNYDKANGEVRAQGIWGYYMGIGTGNADAEATFGWKISSINICSDGFSRYYMDKGQSLRLIKIAE